MGGRAAIERLQRLTDVIEVKMPAGRCLQHVIRMDMVVEAEIIE